VVAAVGFLLRRGVTEGILGAGSAALSASWAAAATALAADLPPRDAARFEALARVLAASGRGRRRRTGADSAVGAAVVDIVGAEVVEVDAGVTARVPNRCGLPVCLTPGELMPHNMAAFVAPGNHHEQGKSRAPKCAACAFADRCAGTWTQYLERFGDEALSPLDELPAPLRDGIGRTASQP
jgi:hypothetical protein